MASTPVLTLTTSGATTTVNVTGGTPGGYYVAYENPSGPSLQPPATPIAQGYFDASGNAEIPVPNSGVAEYYCVVDQTTAIPSNFVQPKAGAPVLSTSVYDVAEGEIYFVATGGTPGGAWTVYANPYKPSLTGAVVLTQGTFGPTGASSAAAAPSWGPSPYYVAVDATTGLSSNWVQAPPGTPPSVILVNQLTAASGATVFSVQGGTPGGPYNILGVPAGSLFLVKNATVLESGSFDQFGNAVFSITPTAGSVGAEAIVEDQDTSSYSAWFEVSTPTSTWAPVTPPEVVVANGSLTVGGGTPNGAYKVYENPSAPQLQPSYLNGAVTIPAATVFASGSFDANGNATVPLPTPGSKPNLWSIADSTTGALSNWVGA